MTPNTDLNLALFERAKAVIPGGVNSPVRAFNAVGGTPRFVKRAQGAYFWDTNDQQFVDYMLDTPFQSDIPLQMFVYPANPDAPLPDLFVQFGQTPDAPVAIDAAAIEANREQWIRAWSDVMLR